MRIGRLVDSATEKTQVNISVRSLVEFILASGDIDDSHGSQDPTDAMQAGSKIHRKIQNMMGSSYHAEVGLNFIVDFEDYEVAIEGRADGIKYDLDEDGKPQDVLIDEIKGMYYDVNELEEPFPVHEAQALCYAYFFSTEHELSEIKVQLTYANLETEEIRRLKKTWKYEDLQQWFARIIGQYKRWSDYLFYHRQERNDSINGLAFPFEYRPGQQKLVADVYRSIKREKLLFIQAPTGTGKTVATLYPAIQAMGQSLANRVFYLTAKTATATVARDTLSLLNTRGYLGKTVMLTAKDKMCLLEERACNPKDCMYACGHFDRINDAVYDLITHESVITRELITEYARKHTVCPFEMSLDVSLWMDHIICDYNYVFDPNVYLKRFFAEGKGKDHIFLIDEAHNMVDRAREMYSEILIKEEFLYMKKVLSNYSKKGAGYCDKANKIMLSYKRQMDNNSYIKIDDIDSLTLYVYSIQTIIEELFSKEIKFGQEQDAVLDFYFRLRNYSNIMAGFDRKHYRVYCEFDEDKQFVLHLFCIDPSAQLQERLDMAKGSVYFSATLLPVNYYKELLCADKDVYAIYATSVFDTKKRVILIGEDVTSKYTRRTAQEYQRFARYIKHIVEAKQGNYMVFGPSYKFLEDVYVEYRNLLMADNLFALEPPVDILLQQPSMKEAEREDFLKEFSVENRGKSLVAFCTLGGIFSEGIDLANEKLIGTIILGAGLPQIGNERLMMQEFFEEQGRNGFEYAYQIPGLNKVVQAAGRLIRTTDDVGVIALLDERFKYSGYKNAFPREWSDAIGVNIENVSAKVTNFWSDLM